jgi:plasmid stabilization system protein ParE
VDFQIRITEAALADFEEILAYSWVNFPARAERFGNAILNHIELLRSFPYIGSPVKGRPGGVPVGAYPDLHLLPR